MWRKGGKGSITVQADLREQFNGLFVEKYAKKTGTYPPNDHHTLARRTIDYKDTVHKERDYPIVRFNGKTWEEYRVFADGIGRWVAAREFPYG